MNYSNIGFEEPITYEINTLYELCLRNQDVFGSPIVDYFHEALRNELATAGTLGMSPGSFYQKMADKTIKDLMWNFKINPELEYVISDQIHASKYYFVENIEGGGSQYVPCERFLEE